MFDSPVLPAKLSENQWTQLSPVVAPELVAFREKVTQMEKTALADKKKNEASRKSLLEYMQKLVLEMEKERCSQQRLIKQLERIILMENRIVARNDNSTDSHEEQLFDSSALPLENLFDLPTFDEVIDAEPKDSHAKQELKERLDVIEDKLLERKTELVASTKAIVLIMEELVKKMKLQCDLSLAREREMKNILTLENLNSNANSNLLMSNTPLLLGRKRVYAQSNLKIDATPENQSNKRFKS